MQDSSAIQKDNLVLITAEAEAGVLGRSVDDRWKFVLDLLDRISRYTEKGGLIERGMSDDSRSQAYTRIASVLTDFFVAPETTMSYRVLVQLIRKKLLIHSIFDASGYRGTGHLKQMLAVNRAGKQWTYTGTKVVLLLALLALDDLSDELIDAALNHQSPDVRLALILGWLNQRAVLTKRAETHRERLLNSGQVFGQANLRPALIGNAINAWMYSSYASTPSKHDFKGAINALFQKLMVTSGITPRPVSHNNKARPKILVVHERFTSQHAMYRCYAPAIRSLGLRFELVAMSDAENMDDTSKKLFEKTIIVEPKKTPLSDLVRMIQEESPDIVYYPSLGMSHWTTILSTLRLAPMQFITLGHPATSKSNAIDYVYTSDMHGDLSSVFSERVLVGPKKAMFEAPPVLPATPCEAVDNRETLKVAINSKVMKISHRLLEICARLERESNRRLEFVLFPGERFHYFDGLVPNLKAQLSSVKVMRYVGYEDFVAELRTCHLAFAAFPFGNTNSTVDTCLLGIPTVAHFGPESPAQSDRLVMETVGLPDWLACDSDENYYNAALRLIQNDELRNQLRDQLLNTDIKKLVFETPSADINVFPEMIMWAYENHLALQKSDTRVYHYENLPNL